MLSSLTGLVAGELQTKQQKVRGSKVCRCQKPHLNRRMSSVQESHEVPMHCHVTLVIHLHLDPRSSDNTTLLHPQDGAAVQFLPKSAYLSTSQHASAYVRTATRLLSQAHSQYCAYPQHRTFSTSDASANAKTGNPLDQLWPLAEGTFASQLLAQLPKEELLGLCLLYWRLLAALPDLAPACGSTPQAEEARFVNALVRATSVL